ncbi:3-oxoacid CoA-transferase subunit B [Calditerrivibrio sp.]|uniref:3-oxoacid CoA-transferase subunit B n=1 Tax=Calditerrivibrio sp. TaxID=2792612 RepID=UPI003D0CED44
MKPIFYDAKEAIKDLLKDNMTIAAGGFGLCGIPEKLILAIRDSGVKNLTFVSNNAGVDNFGLGLLLQTKQIKKMISSYVGENSIFEKQFLNGELEVELTPQGTLAEKLRAGGAGIPAFYTRTGFGTVLCENKEIKSFNGKEYVLEESIVTDISIVKGWKADKSGNVIFRYTANNFNEACAKAGKITVVEVEEIVEVGELDPMSIHLPGIYVDRIVVGKDYEKPIEQRTVSDGTIKAKGFNEQKEWMAKRIVKEFKDGYYINLGIGMPTLVANYIPEDMDITLHSENGLLGVGPFPKPGEEDPDLINAGKQTITYKKGATFFDSSESFAMVRGGHIDISVLGGMEVSQYGDLANWMIPGKMVKGPGGAMDLVNGVKKLIVMMEHTTKDGQPKIVNECTYPITGKNVVSMIVTEKGVFTVDPDKGLTLIEISPYSDFDDIKRTTGVPFKISDNLK